MGLSVGRRPLRVGLVGAGFMGKMHSIGYAVLPILFPTAPAVERTVLAEVDAELAASAAHQFGFAEWVVGWESLVAREDIDIVDIVTPNNLHSPIACAALAAGKHVLCEKPLALSYAEAVEMIEAARRATSVHMVAFNYRHTPAVAQARAMIEQGMIGDIQQFRGAYLQDLAADPRAPLTWRYVAREAGSGALGDIGSHIIDYAHYLVGGIREVSANLATFVRERPLIGRPEELGQVDVDDTAALLLRFICGAQGTIECSRFYRGRKNALTFEISGTRGALRFDWERRNQLEYYSADDPPATQGFHVIETGPAHPYGQALWPIAGIGTAYIETAVLQARELVSAIADERPAQPSFEDGLRVAGVMDAALRSATDGRWAAVER